MRQKNFHRQDFRYGGFLIALLLLTLAARLSSSESLRFDIQDTGAPAAEAQKVLPWRTVALDADYGGLWVVAGDLTGDGEVEIVSAENYNENDVHYTSAVAAQRLDGTVLWTWGDPEIGRKTWHHDVACQIHDWNGDGRNEVILATKGALVELDGATGRERRRIPIREDAADCLVFCDLSGKGRPTDVLVKTRYTEIWAFNVDGDLLWQVDMPGGQRTAHQPYPVDLDGDGRDEIFAGYAMLNHDGTVRWVYRSIAAKDRVGHLDCARVLRRGATPEDFRLALTCCGANNLAVIDGLGKIIWERSGHHFESIKIGNVFSDVEGPQIVVDIDHRPMGESPLWIFDENGQQLGQIVTDYSRHHALIDWTGDGNSEIAVGHNGAIYDHRGRRIVTLALPEGAHDPGAKGERSILTGDFTGDGVPDILLTSVDAVYLYKNEKGRIPSPPAPLGTGLNVTLY